MRKLVLTMIGFVAGALALIGVARLRQFILEPDYVPFVDIKRYNPQTGKTATIGELLKQGRLDRKPQ
jgi:hypothetical protein